LHPAGRRPGPDGEAAVRGGTRTGRRGRGRARSGVACRGGTGRGAGGRRPRPRHGRRGAQPASRAVRQRGVLPVAAPRRAGGGSRPDHGGGIGMREALLVTNTGRRSNFAPARTVSRDLLEAGFGVRVLAEEAAQLDLPGVVPVSGPGAADGVEIVFALGGDGTVLRAAELARPAGAPLLGINLGHVGFLTEADVDDLDRAVRDVVDRAYTVDERLTLDVTAECDGEVVARSWALNEVTVEKGAREKMLEVLVDVDGRPLSRYGCDGVVCATPTGSTAYAFSA